MKEQIAHILKHPLTIPVAVGVTSFGGGLTVGYFWGKRKQTHIHIVEESQMEFDFDVDGMAEEISRTEQIIEEEGYSSPIVRVPETRAEVTDEAVIVRPNPVKEIIEQHLDPVKEIIEQHLDDEVKSVEMTEETVVEVNVFETEDPDWDWEAEVSGRDVEKPYILHRDEFHRDDMDFTQSTLTFYEGDQLMADDNNVIVYNHENVVGPLQWGHGSGDPNVVYIRNEILRGEYEILRHEGYYQVEALGYDIEEQAEATDLRHSREPLRFRMD